MASSPIRLAYSMYIRSPMVTQGKAASHTSALATFVLSSGYILTSFLRGPVTASGRSGLFFSGVLMPFSEEIARAAWARSGGRCECRQESHGHGERCHQFLLWSLRGSDSLSGGWEVRRRTTWGTDVLQNCQILCARCQGPKIAPAE